MRITRHLAVAAASAAAIAVSAWLSWGTATFGDVDVRPTSVLGWDLDAGRALVALAAIAAAAVALSALAPHLERVTALIGAAAGVGVLALVAGVASSTGGIVDAATDTAAGRIAGTTGLPAEHLAAMLRERVAGGSTVALGIGIVVAAAGAIALVVSAVPSAVRRRSEAPTVRTDPTGTDPTGTDPIGPGTEHLQTV